MTSRRRGWARLVIAAWFGVFPLLIRARPRPALESVMAKDDTKARAKPLGLNEADENTLRNLLSRVREHDRAFLIDLLADTLCYTQPDSSVTIRCSFDSDEILERVVLVSKGTAASSRLFRVYKAEYGL